MSFKINLGAWGSVFAVPSKVVDEGLKFADGVKLKVLLFMLRNADRELNLEAVSKATGVNVTDIPEALEYWVSRDILQQSAGVFAPVDSHEETKQPEPPQIPAQPEEHSEKEIKTPEAIAQEVEEKKQRFVVTKPQKPDYVYTAQRLAVDSELKFLVGEAQTMLGKTLSNADAATLLMLKDTEGLKTEVILMLMQYCVSIGKGNMRTIEKIGSSWANDGINSVEDADARIAEARRSSNCFSVVSSVFGLRVVGSPTKKQMEYCTRWVGEWKFSKPMLREAYERCVDSKSEVKFSYIDGILKKWNALGIKNLDDLKASEEGAKPAAAPPAAPAARRKKTSYNIKEIEKIDTLDNIE